MTQKEEVNLERTKQVDDSKKYARNAAETWASGKFYVSNAFVLHALAAAWALDFRLMGFHS